MKGLILFDFVVVLLMDMIFEKGKLFNIVLVEIK